MPTKGRTHFDTYTAQNRVKHAILTKYFGAYLQALSRRADAFHYIDGFAGAGEYASEHAGSPLYALELLAKQAKPATASFVERDPVLFKRLEQVVNESQSARRLIDRPLLRCAAFSDCVGELLARLVFRRFRRVATFAFVDPCGLTGLYAADLAKILALPFGECLVFLNYDGLNRWVGGVSAGTHTPEKLERFFGNAKTATEALDCLRPRAGMAGEATLLDIYLRAVRDHSGARFVLPFRFRAGARERTSHYLIHLSQHPLAFTIMKDVMKSESSKADDYGEFGFIPPEELANQGALFQPNAERARIAILEELRLGERRVSLFAKEWPERPSDMLVGREYKRLLLQLETEAKIDVIDALTLEPAPIDSRPKRSGIPTLADHYLVRLRV